MVTHADASPGLHPERSTVYQPHIDIHDTGADVVLVADLPGATAGGIDVTFDDGVLTLKASVPSRALPGRTIRRDYGVGDYRRAFRLGEGFDAAAITADYRAGVLTVRVPRVAAAVPRRVPVVAAG